MNLPFPFETDKPLSQLSTFGIGGPARFFCEVRQIEDLQKIIAYCHTHHMRYLVVGKGSNCLFDDRGFNGVVILNKISFCHFEWPMVHVGAGYSFSLLGVQTARQGWSGLEFASGIPATVGGAVYMNAGANGTETVSSLAEVEYINEKGELELLKKQDLHFSYRTSSFQSRQGAIVSAKFLLTPSEEARKKQLTIVDYRTKTQPYGEKSAGCVFRNPTPQSAGALIQQAGLKGTRLGGAEVSDLHANFIVNTGSAKAQDVLGLAELVRHTVKEKAGVDLEMEIRCIPYE